jgi:hypothetical protein
VNVGYKINNSTRIIESVTVRARNSNRCNANKHLCYDSWNKIEIETTTKKKMKCENSSGSNDYILVIRKEPYQLLLLLCMNRVKILQKGVVDSASSLLKIVYITSMAFLLNFASLLSCSAWLNDLSWDVRPLGHSY